MHVDGVRLPAADSVCRYVDPNPQRERPAAYRVAARTSTRSDGAPRASLGRPSPPAVPECGHVTIGRSSVHSAMSDETLLTAILMTLHEPQPARPSSRALEAGSAQVYRDFAQRSSGWVLSGQPSHADPPR